jgi:membrane associated rhomboid family serine protease
VNALVVAAGGALLQWAPSWAGTVTLVLFVPLVLAPLVLARITQTRVHQQRLREAARLARIAAWLHPSPQARLNAAMLAAQAVPGKPAQIEAMRRVAAETQGEDRLVIEATILRQEGRWEKLLDLFEARPLLASQLAGLKLRALGECGQLDRMTRIYDDAKSRLHAGDLTVAQLVVLAFAGRPREVEQLFEGPLTSLDADTRTYWLAIAERAAGSPLELWRPVLDRLAAGASAPGVAEAARRQLDRSPEFAAPARIDDISAVIVDDCAARVARAAGQTASSNRPTPLTWALLAAIAAGYALSEMRGGSQNMRTLVDLGALWPPYVTLRGEWWRLVTALFLHWGPIHAVVNAIMLLVLGRTCERAYGTWRMALIYGLGGLASTTFVWWLAATGYAENSVLVGASGAIMALFGALAGRLLVTWLSYRDVLDGKNLITMAVIVALQVAVDLMVPQVSLAAHASGLVAGSVIGGLLTWFASSRAAHAA